MGAKPIVSLRLAIQKARNQTALDFVRDLCICYSFYPLTYTEYIFLAVSKVPDRSRSWLVPDRLWRGISQEAPGGMAVPGSRKIVTNFLNILDEFPALGIK